MLVLSRKQNESILIDGNIRITIVGVRGNHVRVGIEAPDLVRIFREELCAGTVTDDSSAEPQGSDLPRSALARTPAARIGAR